MRSQDTRRESESDKGHDPLPETNETTVSSQAETSVNPEAQEKGAPSKERPLAMQAVIPGLPKTVAQAIELWRRGSPELLYRPLRLYATAKERRNLIPRYSNTVWVRSSQKFKYLRFQKLAKAVAACNTSIKSVFDEGEDGLWNQALNTFCRRFEEYTPLTTMLRSLKK